MSLGEIDTLNLTFDKLQALFDESQGYYESFLDANNLYKAGKLSDKEFFQKLGDYTVAYSALEFLAVKTLMEMKKTLDKVTAGAPVGGTQSPGLKTIVWDGRDFMGNRMAAGIYIYQLKSGNYIDSKKMLFVK